MKEELIELINKLDKDSLASFIIFWYGDDLAREKLIGEIESSKDLNYEEGIRHIKMNYEIN